MIDPNGFCYVEPRNTTAPIVDDLTRKAAALWHACKADERIRYRGCHSCTGDGCHAMSDNQNHYLPDGRLTHSLLVHYVSCHRDDLPQSDLAFIAGLTQLADPTDREI